MFNPILHQYPDFGSKVLSLDNKAIEEEFDFESFVSGLAKRLKAEADYIMKGLESSSEVDEEIMAIIRFVHAIEQMQMHLELTVEIYGSKSKEEVAQIKQLEKFKLISKAWEKTNSKEDIAVIPIRHMLYILHNKVLIPLVKLLKKLYEPDQYGDLKLKRNHHNHAKVRILTNRYEILDVHYPLVVSFDQNDIFCQPKSSQIWQDVYEVATFKSLLTKEEAAASFKPFHFSSFIGHLMVKKVGEMEKASNFQKAIAILKVVLSHSNCHEKAELAAMLHLVNPPAHQALAVWNLTEHPIISTVSVINNPIIGFDECIYVPRLYPAITKELILKEYADKSLNKFQPIPESLLCRIDFGFAKSEVIDELFVKNDNKIQIRILAPEHLHIKRERPTIMKQILHSTAKIMQRDTSVPETSHLETAIIVHIHGGGFIACSSGTQRLYLNRWVKNLKLIHFCIDYRLAPKDKYPAALDDVWQAYLWIVNYAETILGIKNSKIILTGDSAGGNLAMALMLRLVKAGIPPPHGCLLMYPCLYVDALSCSPSYFTSLEDPVLTMNMLKLVAYSYVDPAFNHLEDPFICPMLAGEELLSKMPPIRIVVGSEDALYDDNWRLVHKLRKVKKDVKIIVHENLPHAFLGQPEIKNYNMFIEEACDLVREMISIEKKDVEI